MLNRIVVLLVDNSCSDRERQRERERERERERKKEIKTNKYNENRRKKCQLQKILFWMSVLVQFEIVIGLVFN